MGPLGKHRRARHSLVGGIGGGGGAVGIVPASAYDGGMGGGWTTACG